MSLKNPETRAREGSEAAFIKRAFGKMIQLPNGEQQLDYEDLRQAVKDDPETAAAIVYQICRDATLNSTDAQLIATIAALYQNEFDDDSLVQEFDNAAWEQAASFKKPRPVQEDSELLDSVLDGDEDTLEILLVNADDLRNGSVKDCVEQLSIGGANAERLQKLKSLWGMCLLTFPLEDDPRQVYQIPEARQYIAKLHQEMPYFPCYLNFRREFGMFMTYFGGLADGSASAESGVNILHPSVIDKVIESMSAIGLLAAAIRQDYLSSWRAMLSCYPPDIAELLIKSSQEYLDKLWRKP